ncbi:MAG: TlyA family RNA methyltransferase [Acidobacteria bacterium]|nr:TlyA family RNA methyltransferase [Acidobacteriota bacterium]
MARLDQELFARGLARSRTHAAEVIAAGRVTSAGQLLGKASVRISAEQDLQVADDGGDEYASRAAHKLVGALAAFPHVAVEGLRVLDAGASTGGFTDVLLRRGAAEVVAVDVGHDQLVSALRADQRVRVYEGMNIRYMSPEDIGGQVDLTVGDLSFISLTLVLAPLAAATRAGGELLLMVKPQFEVGKDRLARTGVVGSEVERRRAVGMVASAAVELGLDLQGLAPSPLPGQDGNVEYFLHLRTAPDGKSVSGDMLEQKSRLGADPVAALLDGLWPQMATDR